MFDQDIAEINACVGRLDSYSTLLNTLKNRQYSASYIRGEYLNAGPALGLSQENWDATSPTMRMEMSQEALKGVASTGASLLSKVTGLYTKFGPTIKTAGSTLMSVHKFVQDLRNAASQAATKVSAKNAELGVAAVHEQSKEILKQGARGLANTKQIKLILLAMTAALGFVGYALSSLNNAIRQKEGLPTLSQKLSAKLRSIRWPFGDFGLSTGSDTHLGDLTINGKPTTSVSEDASSQLGTHTTASEMNFGELPSTDPTDPFSDADAEQSKTGLISAIKAHPILSLGTAIAGVVGIFILCNKILSYVITGGAALIKKSLAPYAGSLKVRPLA